MNQKQKKMRKRIIIAALFFVPLFWVENFAEGFEFSNVWIEVGGFLIPYLIIGWDIIYRAWRNIKNGNVFDENFLMCIATFGAFAVGEYLEAVAVMLFYQIGELFQSYAVGRSRESISELMEIYPEYANIEKDGELVQVDPDDVEVGMTIVVKSGERIPLDGIVIEGTSFVDTSALTGESVPRRVSAGEELISGCVNGNGVLKVRVTKEFDDSTVAKILELVENASSKKAKVENFITRFAKYYTPFVVYVAIALAVLPPLFLHQPFAVWLRRACILLVISCPCALVISVPLGFFGGIGAASRNGVLVKGSNYLEVLSEVKYMVFDKTGTLTKGDFAVTRMEAVDGNAECMLEKAALAESYSEHPVAKAVLHKWNKMVDKSRVSDVEEIPGHGMKAIVDGNVFLVGNIKLMNQQGVVCDKVESPGTVLYIAENQKFRGFIEVADSIKEDAIGSLKELKKLGVEQLIMLTGDKEETGNMVSQELGIDKVYAELLPQNKVEKVEEILENAKYSGKVCFVGDGINDAPVLGRVDVGIAMGSMGSDAAIEAADIVLMDDDIRKIASVMKIARKTLVIVKQNIVFALGVKGLVLVLGAVGMAGMWEAVFADVGVSVIAILNSMRMLKKQ